MTVLVKASAETTGGAFTLFEEVPPLVGTPLHVHECEAASSSTSRAPLPDPDTPAPIRFLPKWDNVLLAWADRTRVLPEAYRKTVIRMNGDVAQTFLVDGFVAGTWRVEDGRVVAEPFEPLPRSTRREVEDEAGRLQAFLND